MMSPALENYFRLMTANGAVRIYRAAWKHGVLEALAKEPMPLHALAEATALNTRALQLLLDGLSALGIVEESGGAFRPGAVVQALQGGYRALGDEYWDHLDAWLATGVPLRRMDTAAEGESAYRDQASALAWMMAPAAAQLAGRLGPALPPRAAILDIGAGSGVWSMALLSVLPEAIATVVDRAGVLETARKFAAQAAVESRVRCLAGDYHDVEIPGASHDIALVANVCHLETEAGNLRLLRRVAHWLRPGGRIAIVDVAPDEQPLTAALYALGLALRTESAAVPTSSQIRRWMDESGFVEQEFHMLRAAPGTMGLWTALRPQSGEHFPGHAPLP